MHLKQYDKANKLIHNYLNTSESFIKSDHYALARILHLFIQLELGHHDYVASDLRNLSRHLKEKKKLFQFETICLDTISALCDEQQKKKIKMIWKLFSTKINALSKIKHERNAMFSFNFSEWSEFKSQE
jgi:hypothetical protein